MRKSQLVAAIVAATLAAGFGIAGATPASAKGSTCVSINGVWPGTIDPGVVTWDDSATFAAGDQLTVTWSTITGATEAALQVPTGITVDTGTATETLSYTIPSAGDQNYIATLSGEFASGLEAWITITCGQASSSASGDAVIPAWVQGYGIFHHDDACLTGWTNSWQHWAEPITGGWVCTRTIPSLG